MRVYPTVILISKIFLFEWKIHILFERHECNGQYIVAKSQKNERNALKSHHTSCILDQYKYVHSQILNSRMCPCWGYPDLGHWLLTLDTCLILGIFVKMTKFTTFRLFRVTVALGFSLILQFNCGAFFNGYGGLQIAGTGWFEFTYSSIGSEPNGQILG